MTLKPPEKELLSISKMEAIYSDTRKYLTTRDVSLSCRTITESKNHAKKSPGSENATLFNIRFAAQMLTCGIWNKHVHNGTIANINTDTSNTKEIRFSNDKWSRSYYSKLLLVPIDTTNDSVVLTPSMFKRNVDRLTFVDLDNKAFLQVSNFAMNHWYNRNHHQVPGIMTVASARNISGRRKSSYMKL